MKKILLVLCLMLVAFGAQAQTWQYTTSMNDVRWLAGMVSLNNQTALMVGGFHAGGGPGLASCEIYDPVTATWSYTGSLHVGRAYPTLVKLGNGHILSMCGGLYMGDGAATPVVEDYDPATGVWTVIGSLNTARFVPTATVLANGKVLLAGGLVDGSTSSTSEVFDPTTGTSVTTGVMNERRYEHQAVLMGDGKVMVNGGRDGGSGSYYSNDVEIFDPATGTWTVAPSMVQARMEAITTRFSDNTILAAAGRNTPGTSAPGSEVFDPSTMTWNNTAAVMEPVCWAGSIPFPDDRFMITGGMIDANWGDAYGLDNLTTPKCEWYDHTFQAWYFAPELNLSRCRHNAVYIHQTTSTEIPEEFLLVAGGQTGTVDASGAHFSPASFTNTAEILDVTPSALKAYMKLPTNAHASVNTVAGIDNNFKVYYQTDGSMGVAYTTTTDDNVTIEVMSVDGRMAKRIMNNVQVSSGAHTATIQTNDLAGGAYFIHYATTHSNHVFKFNVTK